MTRLLRVVLVLRANRPYVTIREVRAVGWWLLGCALALLSASYLFDGLPDVVVVALSFASGLAGGVYLNRCAAPRRRNERITAP